MLTGFTLEDDDDIFARNMHVVTETKGRRGTYPPGHIMSVSSKSSVSHWLSLFTLTLELKTKNNKKRLEKRQGYSACDSYNSLLFCDNNLKALDTQ